MPNTEVPLLYNRDRLSALQKALDKSNLRLDERLHQTMDALYREYVPVNEQERIEAKISREEAFMKASQKDLNSFGVFHLHNADGDMHIAARKCNNLLGFARLYQSQLCRKVDTYSVDSLACLFGEYRELDVSWFQVLCDSFNSNPSVSLIADVDFERGYISFMDKTNPNWTTYRLDDIAEAAAEAFDNPDASDYEQWETFLAELSSKQTDAEEAPSEDAGMTPQL